jgi:hypothetical protein
MGGCGKERERERLFQGPYSLYTLLSQQCPGISFFFFNFKIVSYNYILTLKKYGVLFPTTYLFTPYKTSKFLPLKDLFNLKTILPRSFVNK